MTPDDHAVWLKRVSQAEAQQALRHGHWQQALDAFSMELWTQQFPGTPVSDERVPVNYAVTFVLTRIASLNARNPKIFVRPRSGMGRMQPFAETMERLLERFWDDAELKEEATLVLRDAILFGIGWMEVGYTASLRHRPKPVPVGEAEEQEAASKGLFDQLRDVLGQKPPALPSEQGELEPQRQVGEFYCVRRSPYTVLLADGFQRVKTMPYLILWDRLRAEDFLRNPRFQNKERALFSSNDSTKRNGLKTAEYTFDRGSGPGELRRYGVTDQQTIDLYQVWDRRSMTVTTISKGCDVPHEGPDEWPDLADGWPVVDLTFVDVPETPEQAHPYPFGFLQPIMGQIMELSGIRQSMVEHRRRAQHLLIVTKGGLTEQEVANYARTNDAVAMVPVTNAEAVKVAPAVAIPNAVFETERAIKEDLDRDSMMQLALDPNAAAKTDRATVANIIQTNANLGTVFFVDRIEGFHRRVGRALSQRFWQYKTRMQVGEELGVLPDPEAWPPLPKDAALARKRIQRELELRIEGGSTRPIQDDVLDREQFLRYISIFQAVSPGRFKRVEPMVLSLMAKKFREPALESAILRAMDEEEAQGAQTENMLLLQGHPQYVSPGEDHETHDQVHSQAEQTPLVVAHRKAHAVRQNELMAGQATAGQGVRQSTAAPSSAEVSRMGTPDLTDVGGQSFNVRRGTGQEAVVAG